MNAPNVDNTTNPPMGTKVSRPKGKYINQVRTKKFKHLNLMGCIAM